MNKLKTNLFDTGEIWSFLALFILLSHVCHRMANADP